MAASTNNLPYKRKVVIGSCTLLLGDCLDILPTLGKVDAIVTDPPYGTTACNWDSIIDLDIMWSQLKKITNPSSAVILFSSQPFTTKLISSNYEMFKYEWIWGKNRPTGFLASKKQPLKSHENILVFVDKGCPTYNPQKTTGHKPTSSAYGYGHAPTFGKCGVRDYKGGDTTRFPKSVQYFKSDRGFHPTQKPVALMEYLVKTYSNDGDTVLDFTMGSGTTGVACAKLGRKFIGIEIDPSYFDIACERIAKAYEQGDLFVGQSETIKKMEQVELEI